MKIIAGIEQSYQGEVVWAPGYSVGYLEQEPQMDPEKTVLEVVQEGVQEIMDVLKEYEEVNLKFCEPMSDDEMNKLIERQGELTEKIEHCGGWEIDSKLERAMDALQCPPSDAKIANLSGGERRRVALCRLCQRGALTRRFHRRRFLLENPKFPYPACRGLSAADFRKPKWYPSPTCREFESL